MRTGRTLDNVITHGSDAAMREDISWRSAEVAAERAQPDHYRHGAPAEMTRRRFTPARE